MADKTIRYNIDDKGVAASNDRIRRSFEDTQKKIIDTQKEGRKLSLEEIKDLEKKIRLQEQLNKQQEQQLRKDIETRTVGYKEQQFKLDDWVRQRNALGRDLPPERKAAWDRETNLRADVQRESISRQKQDILHRRKEYSDTREDNKKQISELRNITDTIKGESVKGRRDTGMMLNRVLSGGVGNALSGNLGGLVSMPMSIMGGLAGAALLSKFINNIQGFESTSTRLASATQLPYGLAKMITAGAAIPGLGIGQKEAIEMMSMFTGSAKRFVGGSEFAGLAGMGVTRGISNEQIAQLLSLQRYSGVSPFGAVSGFENFTGNRGLLRVPELLDSYLRVANQILQKTGRIDAISLQQTMMSIGKSYGVQGVNLDRMVGNLSTVSGTTTNPILRAMQMETLRSLNPNMSTWEMQGVLENPTANPQYMKAFVNRMSKFGGGGDWTKFALMNMGFGSYSDIEKITSGQFQLAGRPSDSGSKELQDKYLQSGADMTGTLTKLSSTLGQLYDIMVGGGWKAPTNPVLGIYSGAAQYEKALEDATYRGTERALQKHR